MTYAYWSPGVPRAANWPSVPTLRETGVDIAVKAPYGLAGLKRIDPKVIKILHDAFKRGMEDPAFIATLARLNEHSFYMDADAYRDFVTQSLVDWRKVIDEVGARSQ